MDIASVLITGGAGFIGSNLVHLVARERPGWRIVVLDALTYAGNLESLGDLLETGRVEFRKGDVCSRTDVESALAACGDPATTAVMHLAAESHVDRSIQSGLPFVETNVVGTQILLDAARAAGTARFLHVSTDEVYGSLGATGHFREDSPIQPSSPYAASKASSDLLVRAAHHTHGFDVVITNCSNNYGPYQFPEKLIPLMIANALEGAPLPVYGDGKNVRDWLYVEDHCEALLTVLERGRSGETYNIGGNNEYPNIDIVERIVSATGASRDQITYVKDRPGHDRRYAIDAAKIREELGWSPRFTFEEALPLTIDWFRSNKGWLDRVRSGAYRDYYAKQYDARESTAGGATAGRGSSE
jgi:dTDP-glucose 4,6-dehydratase